jgi:uncharacterized protein YndB with AHSA1/START domain
MSLSHKKSDARAVADLMAGSILATVEIAAPQGRVFRALASDEITQWWGSAGTYRTTAFEAELKVGGTWRAEGVGADGVAFTVQGEYLEIDPPKKLSMTWRAGWDQDKTTTLTYRLEVIPEGTRITLRHDGFSGRRVSCQEHALGWEQVLSWLQAHCGGGAS